MWQNIVIAVVVLLCALYIGRKFCKQARGQAGCGCSGGCSGCPPPPGGAPPGQPPGESSGSCGCGEQH